MAKKKNTYSIKFSHLVNYSMFELCRETPLVIAKKNGAVIQDGNGGWDTATPFPNPGATVMGANFHAIRAKMGDKMATTIIEYLDKETNKPVATVFPTHVYIHDGYENNFNQHLNHASRKDLAYQIMMRRRALER